MGSKDPEVIAYYDKYQKINPEELDHAGFLTWSEVHVGNISPIAKEELLNKSNQEISEYLSTYREEKGWRKPSIEGLSETLRNCVLENPEKFATNLIPFLKVQRIYQHALLWGLSDAWRAKKDFTWDGVIDFILQIIESKEFWNEEHPKGSYYRNWIISQIAALIEEGTEDDKHAFDAKLLPRAEEILLALEEKVRSELPEMNNLVTSVLNSEKGKIFSALMNYSLRYARLFRTEQTERWVKAVKEDFDRRLDHEFEPSLEFSLTLGKYLTNLGYLDEKWVKYNINKIFPKDNEKHWQAAFIGYLFYSRIYGGIYSRVCVLSRQISSKACS